MNPEVVAADFDAGGDVDVLRKSSVSDVSWRTPAVQWRPPLPIGMRCGNINSLQANEIVTLAPGERVELNWLGSPRFTTPGRHRIQVQLEHDPDATWGGIPLGEHDHATMARVRQTPPFVTLSNEVEIEVWM